MADFIQTGGTNGGSYARYFSGILSVWENSYDINSNTSNVGYRLQLKSGSSGRFSGLTASFSVTINGVTVNSGSGTYSSQSYNTAQTICEGSTTIGHNDDGTKTIGCSAALDFQSHTYSPGDFYPSGNLTLTTIPRYANITKLEVKTKTINSITLSYRTDKACKLYVNLNNGQSWLNNGQPFASNTTSGDLVINYKDRASTQRLDYNTTYRITVLCRDMNSGLDTSKDISVSTYDIGKITEAPNTNIGSAQTLTLTNPMNLDTYLKLYTTDDTLVEDFGQISGNSITITPTANLIYPLTPNSNTIILKYVIISTYENNNYEASKECIFTVVNSNPTFSNFDYEDINTTTLALTGNNQIIVKNYSILKGIVTPNNKAIGNNSATIQNYKLLVGNQSQIGNYEENQNVEITLQNPISTNIIDMYATDSRGNSTSVNKVAQMKEYTPIKITSVTATRINSVSTGVILSFDAIFWNDNFGQVSNGITSCIYKYKETSDSTYTTGTTTLTYTINNNIITGQLQIAGDLGSSGFNASNSYNILVSMSDKLSTDEFIVTFGSGEPAMAVYRNNLAIGGKYDTSLGGRLQIYGDIKSDNIEEIPAGIIQEYAGTETPAGWLECDGSEVSRTTYSELYNAIGTTYGDGDGSTTFNLPDLKGRVVVGLNENDEDFDALGNTGGEKTHTLTVDEMPNHNHGQNVTANPGTGGPGIRRDWDEDATGLSIYSQGITTGTRGGGQAHNNLQPYVVLRYIIKATSTIGKINPLIANVIDDLSSSSTTDALSANQGKVLSEKIRKIGTYSLTNEILTGETWVDGKPLYRKVVVENVSNFSNILNIDLGTSNVDIFIDGRVLINTADFTAIDHTATSTSYNMARWVFNKSTNKVQVYNNLVGGITGTIYVIIEYTKTTD